MPKLLSSWIIYTLLFLLRPAIPMAQGNLLIFPRRIVFDSAKRIQNLDLANTGIDSATYIISLVQIRMREDGTFENITEPDSGQYFASKYLRIYPRSVTLAPKESQLIKIQVTQTGHLLPGEYRSHIYFRAAPHEEPAGEKNAPVDSTNLAVKLVPVFGISIPVIIRVGKDSSTAFISGISIDLADGEGPSVCMYLNRTGNMSIYGDLFIDYIPEQGKTIRVGVVDGIAVYTPLLRRKIRIPLKTLPGVDYRKGKLHMLYASQVEKKATVLAEGNLSLHLVTNISEK